MDLMTVIETAEYLRISKQTLYKWNSMGILQPIKLGGVKYCREDIDRLIEEKRKSCKN